MPFTLAHAAAAWPFRRTRLILSAVVMGSFAPDFEYFLRLAPGGEFGHTILGAFVLDVPLSLVVLWLFYAWMREPMIVLLPEPIQRRIPRGPCSFPFWGPRRLALLAASVLVGVATHLLWDSFTHPAFWPWHPWTLLTERVRLPMVGSVPYYKLFQQGSTVAGMAVLLVWLAYWYRTTPEQRAVAPAFPAPKWGLVALLAFLTVAASLVRAWIGVGIPNSPRLLEIFMEYAVITAIALTWLQWLLWGILWSRRQKFRSAWPHGE
ncbi:MAG TPA: DUF4184 family protein [Acidobacteriaceae bacterium]|nr:DUF4184 family protein [Acidobacteriaceae bacterium]